MGAPLPSIVISITSVLRNRCLKKPEKRAWPILGQFLDRRSALWSDAPIEAEKKLRDLVVQAVTKGAAGFHHSSSGEFQFAESARALGREASGAPFAERVGGLFLRKPPTRLHCLLRREFGIRELSSHS